jgi:hypothetical protein
MRLTAYNIKCENVNMRAITLTRGTSMSLAGGVATTLMINLRQCRGT